MDIIVEDWGEIDYTAAFQRQRSTVDAVIAGGCGHLIFCEHPSVVTLGRSFKEASLLYSKEEIEQNGVSVQVIDRGGDVTLHAPGQLVVYVILNLNLFDRHLKMYLENLEQVAVDLLKEFGILAVSIPGNRGVFVPTPLWEGEDQLNETSIGVDQQKIISIGIGVRKWVSYHGLGINVNTDISLFSFIKPCGLNVHMTSMAKLLRHPVAMEDVKRVWVKIFSKTFDVNIV